MLRGARQTVERTDSNDSGETTPRAVIAEMQQLGVRVFAIPDGALRPQFSPVCQTAKLTCCMVWWRAGRRGFCSGDPRIRW